MDDRQRDLPETKHGRLREINERTRRRLDEFHGFAPDPYVLMCECPLWNCRSMIEIAAGAYQHVRSDDAWFVVYPGHVAPTGERAVEQFEGYWIVELQLPMC